MKQKKQRKHGISVIVPVYQVEKYLDQCVTSLLESAQDQDNVEILLIDDGSPDRCGEMCDAYAKDHPQLVKTFHKKNGGLSDARNFGIDKAEYDYLLFVDSDDWVAKEEIPTLLKEIDQGYEIIQFNTSVIDDGAQEGTERSTFMGTDSSDFRQFIKYSTEPSFAHCRLYQYSLFEHVKFPSPDLWYEDVATIPILLSYCTKIKYLPISLYYYRQRMGSITSKSDNPRNLELLQGLTRVMEKGNPEYQKELSYAVYYVLSNFLHFRPKYIDEFLAFAKEHASFFANNPYIDDAIERHIVEDLFTLEPIPKVLHYFWFGGKKPESVARCIESWRRFAPDYEIKEWNESNCDLACSDYVKEAYEAKKYAFVSDYFRVKVLAEEGGIYMDTDMELFTRIDSLRLNKAFFPFETDLLGTCIFGAIPHHYLIEEMFHTYDGEHFKKPDGTLDTTPNPARITKVFRKHFHYSYTCRTIYFNDKVTVYSPDVLLVDVANGNNMAVHHYDATWWDVAAPRGKSYRYEVLKYYFTHKRENDGEEEKSLKKRIYNAGRKTLSFLLPEGAYKKVRAWYRKVKPLKN